MYINRSMVMLCSLLIYIFIACSLHAYAGIRVTINEEAPDFNLIDHNGKMVKLSDYKSKIVVLEWINPDCPYTKRHYDQNTMKQLSKKYSKEVAWLAINSTYYMDNQDNQNWAEKYKLSYPILDDSSGEVGKLYGAKTTPHMFIIDSGGKLVYIGAIDNDPKGISKQDVNYVDTVLTEIINGQAVSLAETKSYGCSVKYKEK